MARMEPATVRVLPATANCGGRNCDTTKATAVATRCPPRTFLGALAGAFGRQNNKTATAARGGQRHENPCGLNRKASAISSAAKPSAELMVAN